MEKWHLLIYAPAYNVAPQISGLINRVKKVEHSITDSSIDLFVIVNDGSTDNTKSALESTKKSTPFLSILDKKSNEGPTKALFDGMGRALQFSSDKKLSLARTIFIRMDTDLEHRPEDLPKLIKPIVSGKAKISVGYIPFDSRSGNAIKQFNEKIGLEESRRFLDLDIPQFCPGFNAIRGDLFARLCPLLTQKSAEFKKKYGKEMLTIDFVILVLAKKFGETATAVKLSPIEDAYVKKQPAEKLKGYLDYHKKTIEFLENEFKS